MTASVLCRRERASYVLFQHQSANARYVRYDPGSFSCQVKVRVHRVVATVVSSALCSTASFRARETQREGKYSRRREDFQDIAESMITKCHYLVLT